MLKNFLLSFSLLFGLQSEAQTMVANASNSVYHIKVWRNDKLIHDHLMEKGDQFLLKIENDLDMYKFHFKIVEYHCDDTNDFFEGYTPTPAVKKGDWTEVLRVGAFLKLIEKNGEAFQRWMYFPPLFCKGV